MFDPSRCACRCFLPFVPGVSIGPLKIYQGQDIQVAPPECHGFFADNLSAGRYGPELTKITLWLWLFVTGQKQQEQGKE
jgi:hypothetical protein